MAKVFGITELLENILLHLPLIDLLFSQRVCKTWHNVVSGSSKIQKALFFTPGTKEDATTRNGVQTYCCVFGRVFRGCQSFTLNPLLRASNAKGDMRGLEALLKRIVYTRVPKTSCRFMLLTQPPTTVAIRYDISSWQRGDRCVNRDVCIEAMTLGELAEKWELVTRNLKQSGGLVVGAVGRWWSEHGVDSEHDACAVGMVEDAHMSGSRWRSDGGL
ncbi:hypothetical protein LTS10_010438 [Elasticomyces elasticus]|nr:hypothetical protein LTS10_010438 [Elasticomyces elasticus]